MEIYDNAVIWFQFKYNRIRQKMLQSRIQSLQLIYGVVKKSLEKKVNRNRDKLKTFVYLHQSKCL